MAVEWTTATIVKANIKGTDVNQMTVAQIEELIEQSEGFMKVILKIPSTFTFNATKKPHLMLRDIVTCRVARRVIAAMSMSFLTLEQAAMAADILEKDYTENLKFLAENPGYIKFIEGS